MQHGTSGVRIRKAPARRLVAVRSNSCGAQCALGKCNAEEEYWPRSRFQGLRSLLGEEGKGGTAGGETGQAMAQITGAHKRLFIDAPSSSSAASEYSLSDAPPSVRSYLPTDAPCSHKWIPAPPTRHSSRARGFAAAAEAPRKPSHMPLKSSYSGFFTRRMNVSVDVNASEDRGPPPCARLLSSAACSLARAGAAQ